MLNLYEALLALADTFVPGVYLAGFFVPCICPSEEMKRDFSLQSLVEFAHISECMYFEAWAICSSVEFFGILSVI